MLMTSLNFSGSEISAKAEPFGTIESENVGREFLQSSLCELFSCYRNGYLQLGAECWAVFKRGQAFFIFDPLGIELREKKTLRRRAALYRFQSIEAMIEQLVRCLKENGGTEDCIIGGVIACVPKEQPQQVKEVQIRKSRLTCCRCDPMPSPNQNVFMLKEIEPKCKEKDETLTECMPIEEPCAN